MIKSVLKSLLKPDAFPEPTATVTLVQTHVSWIFLTDSHAYKIKKPVDFGFLNFTTIDRRRFYCNEELRLNRRLCPDIYEAVVEVRETPTGAAFHGAGAVLDYAVRMKRLPADRMLDRLVAENRVDPADLRRVARVIAEFHRNAPTSAEVAQYGGFDRIMYNWQENFDQTAPFRDSTFPDAERERIRAWVGAFGETNRGLFEARVRDGFIRECDGDIHLENICLTLDGVRVFDCIEFNDRFRCCDTAADIAFLLMDLDFHGRHDLAEETLAAYREASGDAGLGKICTFYKIYRAFVRGKVESFRLNDTGIDQDERDRAARRAIRYFRLCRGYIESATLPPTLFITCGLMGFGKSTVAEQLGFELGLKVFSSDRVRKELAGFSAYADCGAPFGQGLYAESFTSATYGALEERAREELAAGRSVIVDAAFLRRGDRDRFHEMAGRNGARFRIIAVTCSEEEQARRLLTRAAAGASVSDGRLHLLAEQRQTFEPLLEREEAIMLDTTSPDPCITSVIYGKL